MIGLSVVFMARGGEALPLAPSAWEHLAALAGLYLPPEGRDRLQRELDRIVAYIDELDVDPRGRSGPEVAAAAATMPAVAAGQTAPVGRRLRADRPGVPLPPADALAGAGQRAGDLFRAAPLAPGAAPVRTPAAVGWQPAGAVAGSAPAASPPPRAVAGDLQRLTMSDAAALRDRGKVSTAELAAVIARARDRHARSLAAFVEQAPPSSAEPPAAAPDSHSPLAGFGAAIKANICARGWRAGCGSRLLAHYRPVYDATVVRRLYAAGATLVGTTTMDEFGMGSSTEYAAEGPARNPWRLSHAPGGSSGGSAAAVAAGMAWYALGSDTGGSVRLPAHCCGVVGFKPTYGRISRYGLVAYASSLDQIGILARSVTDAALIYRAVAGPDRYDATTVAAPVGDPVAAVTRPPRDLRVGVPRALLAGDLAPAIASDLAILVRDLAADGIALVDVDLPDLRRALAAYYVLACAEAASNLARFDGLVYGTGVAASHWQDSVAATRHAGFGPEVQRRILLGTFVLAVGYYDAYYRRAVATRRRLMEQLRQRFGHCDVLLLPSAATAAFPLGERTGDPLAMYRTDLYTVPASLAGLPAMTVPTGIDADGLPMSVQLVASPFAEQAMLALAGHVERLRRFRDRREAPWLS